MNLQLVFHVFVLTCLPLALVFEQNIPSLIIKFLSLFPLTIALIYLCVFLHELGHYVFLRYFKVRIEIFQVGHGNIILKYQKNSSKTIFQLGSKAFGGENSADIEKISSWKKLLLIFYAGILFNQLTLLTCLISAHTFSHLNPNTLWQVIVIIVSFLNLLSIILLLTPFACLILDDIALEMAVIIIGGLYVIGVISKTNLTLESSSFLELFLKIDLFSGEFYQRCLIYFIHIFVSILCFYSIFANSIPNTTVKNKFRIKIKNKVKSKTKEKRKREKKSKSFEDHSDGTIIYSIALKVFYLKKLKRLTDVLPLIKKAFSPTLKHP